jgi:hypothetical protein
MARAVKNSFLWNFKVHLKDIFGQEGPTFPESKAGKEAWAAFYEDFATFLDENFGFDNVSAAIDYMVKKKKNGNKEKALQLLLGRETAVLVRESLTPTPPSQDPKAIAARRFAAGEIGIADFTAIIEALNAAQVGDNIPPESAKVTAEETEEPTPLPEPVVIPIQHDPEDDDLPF